MPRRDLFLEVAHFDPPQRAADAPRARPLDRRELPLRARHRPEAIRRARSSARRGCIVAVAGGAMDGGPVDLHTAPQPRRRIALHPSASAALLGEPHVRTPAIARCCVAWASRRRTAARAVLVGDRCRRGAPTSRRRWTCWKRSRGCTATTALPSELRAVPPRHGARLAARTPCRAACAMHSWPRDCSKRGRCPSFAAAMRRTCASRIRSPRTRRTCGATCSRPSRARGAQPGADAPRCAALRDRRGVHAQREWHCRARKCASPRRSWVTAVRRTSRMPTAADFDEWDAQGIAERDASGVAQRGHARASSRAGRAGAVGDLGAAGSGWVTCDASRSTRPCGHPWRSASRFDSRPSRPNAALPRRGRSARDGGGARRSRHEIPPVPSRRRPRSSTSRSSCRTTCRPSEVERVMRSASGELLESLDAAERIPGRRVARGIPQRRMAIDVPPSGAHST